MATETPLSPKPAHDSKWWITALVIPLMTAGWGYFQYFEGKNNRDAHEMNEEAKRNGDIALKYLIELRSANEKDKRLAIVILNALKQERLPRYVHAAVIHGFTELYPSPENLKFKESFVVGQRVGSEPNKEDAQPEKSPVLAIGKVAFIQFFDEAQKTQAQTLQDLLRTMGIAAPGIENVTNTAQQANRPLPKRYSKNVIVIFKQADTATALAVIDKAKGKGITLDLQDRSGLSRFANVPEGQMEIWFSETPKPP